MSKFIVKYMNPEVFAQRHSRHTMQWGGWRPLCWVWWAHPHKGFIQIIYLSNDYCQLVVVISRMTENGPMHMNLGVGKHAWVCPCHPQREIYLSVHYKFIVNLLTVTWATQDQLKPMNQSNVFASFINGSHWKFFQQLCQWFFVKLIERNPHAIKYYILKCYWKFDIPF